MKAKREAEARKKVAEDASRLLRSVDARFRKAERATDPADSARLRLEAEERLKDLAAVDPEAWPGARWMHVVRGRPILVAGDGQAPLYEGLRVGVPNAWNPEATDYAEFGRIRGTSIGVREAGSAQWVARDVEELAKLELRPEHLDPDWPEDDQARTDTAVTARIASQLRYSGSWPSLGWHLASDAWLHVTWMRHGPTVVEQLAAASSWYAQQQRVPLVVDGVLRVGAGATLRSGVVLEPTLAGWRHFLDYAPGSGLKFGELAQIGEYWWDRKIPRDLLSAAQPVAAK